MRCDIIMVTWNEVPMTRTALESVREKSGYPYRLIIVDNSDDLESRKCYQDIAGSGEFGETLLIQNNENIGWLRATNLGLNRSDSDYVCLLNNDVICGQNWLALCIGLIEREPDIGLVIPRGNERTENAIVSDVDKYAETLARKEKGRYTERSHCSGFCLVIKRRVIDDVGVLDEMFGHGYYEDNDYSFRAKSAGYRCAQCDEAFVFHLGSKSFKKMPSEERRLLLERNKALFESRWGKAQRRLVLVRRWEESEKELIRLVSEGKTYLIADSKMPPSLLQFRHQNLIFVTPGILGPKFSFLLNRLYLSYKKRIDDAVVI